MATGCSSSNTGQSLNDHAGGHMIKCSPSTVGGVAICVTPNQQQSLKIKTKSIESTLIPLVNQISTLVNVRDSLRSRANPASTTPNPLYSERAANALLKVGEAVMLAVDRFVSVGESIAYENPTIRFDMLEACREARQAGQVIRSQTQSLPSNHLFNLIAENGSQQSTAANGALVVTGQTNSTLENITLMQAANVLLNSVSKVLLLADIVIINQILNSKNRVFLTLSKLENVVDFSQFIALFSQYGSDLIELAHLSGERQTDLKCEKRRAQLASARWTLEKSTVMILSSTKVYMKHLECECAKENINLVYSFIYQALDTLHYVVIDSGSLFDLATSSIYNNSIFKLSIVENPFTAACRQFEDALELAKNNMVNESNENLVLNALNLFIDSSQDFTDSPQVNNEQRERIIRLQNEIRDKTVQFVHEEESINQSEQQEARLLGGSSQQNFHLNRIARHNRLLVKSVPILNDCDLFKKLLQAQALQIANSLFRENQDATLLHCIKTYALSNHYDLLIDSLDKFKEYSDHVLEICKLLRHICSVEVFEVTCEHHYNVFDNFSKLIHSSAGTAALYPSCKSAIENLNLFCENWENQINDFSVLVKEIQDSISNGGVKTNKSIYLSLPRPGKHGTSTRSATITPSTSNSNTLQKPTKLDVEEQARIAKLGLEMKLVQSEIEAEANKWNEPQNEIVKIAKLMSEMAYEIHLFTRGEGSLKTTQDLFNKAEVFLQHGVVLYGIIKEFLNQVPTGYLRDEVIQLLERMPHNYKQLKNRVKQVTAGKTATFNKVDQVIQETRDYMNLVTKLVTNCFLCCTKYNINYDQAKSEMVESSTLNPNYFVDQPPSLPPPSSSSTSHHILDNHLKNFVLDRNNNNSVVDNSMIDECLLAAAINQVKNSSSKTGEDVTLYGGDYMLRSKAASHNVNPYNRLSNYVNFTSSSTGQHQLHSSSRSDSCGPPVFRN